MLYFLRYKKSGKKFCHLSKYVFNFFPDFFQFKSIVNKLRKIFRKIEKKRKKIISKRLFCINRVFLRRQKKPRDKKSIFLFYKMKKVIKKRDKCSLHVRCRLSNNKCTRVSRCMYLDFSAHVILFPFRAPYF